MKKFLLLLGFVAVVHAEEVDNACPPPPPPEPSCDTGGPSLLFYNTPLKEECWTLFVTGDFIFWTARMDGLGYVASKWRNDLGQNPGKGSIGHPDFEFDPGFKVGLGARLPRDGWELYSEYTWLHTGDKTDSRSVANFLRSEEGATWFTKEGPPNSLQTPDSPLVSAANARWDLHFNVIDLELARTNRISRRLDIRPHFGLKGSWHKMHNSIRYRASPDFVGETFRRISQQIDYWGFGMRTGFDTAFHLNKWFRIVGDVAISGLWSGFDVERLDRAAPVDGSSPEIDTFATCNSFHTIVPVFELFLGMRWEKRFNENLYNYMIQVGWEEQVWWKMNEFYRHFEESYHGDLVLQGMTLQLRLDF